MSDSGLDALAATQAVEAKLSEAGADNIRRHTFDETEAAPVETETVAETPRNELGQFTSTTEDDPAEELQAEVVAEGDPAVAAFLNKYGGDVDKALEGAVHLQRKAGQQSNEIGEMRRMVDELSALRETVQADYTQRNQPQMDQATVDWYDQQVMENPQGALQWAAQQNNPMLVQRGLSVWKEIDPYSAAVYTNRLENQALHAQVQAQLAAASQLPTRTQVNDSLQEVLADHPYYVNYDLNAALEAHPFAARAFESATSSGDPSQIKGAIETLYSLAVGDTLQESARNPAGVEDTTTTQDVVSPTVSETRDPAPQPTGTDRFREAFHQEIERRNKGVWVAD